MEQALGKFDATSDKGNFIGYSSHNKAYKVYNQRTSYVDASVHVNFDESDSLKERGAQDNDDDVEIGITQSYDDNHRKTFKRIWLKGDHMGHKTRTRTRYEVDKRDRIGQQY